MRRVLGLSRFEASSGLSRCEGESLAELQSCVRRVVSVAFFVRDKFNQHVAMPVLKATGVPSGRYGWQNYLFLHVFMYSTWNIFY